MFYRRVKTFEGNVLQEGKTFEGSVLQAR